MDSLAQYIEDNLAKGYSEQQIRAALVRAGYPNSMIDAAFTASDPLHSYVQRQLAQGTSQENVKQSLMQQGYTEQQIQAALPMTVRHEMHLPITTFLMLFVLLLVAGGLFFGYRMITPDEQQAPGKLLDADIQVDQQEYQQGDESIAEVRLVNMGEEQRYDVELAYTLTDDREDAVWASTDTKAITTTLDIAKRIPLDLPPGTYDLSLIVTYGGEYPARAATKIVIVDDTIEPVIAPPEERPPPIVILSTSDDQQAVLEEAAAEARKGNGVRARSMCQEITNAARRDSCLAMLVLADEDARNCAAIVDAEKRDTCYMPFVLEGNYALCQELENQERKQLCANLQRLETLEASTTNINSYAQPIGN